jgi:hypothetical protein
MPQEYILWSPLGIDECIRRLNEETEKMQHIRTFRVDSCRLVLTRIDEHGLTLHPALRTRLHYGTYFHGTFEPHIGGTIIRGDFSAHPLAKVPPLVIFGAGAVMSCTLVSLMVPLIIGVLFAFGDELIQTAPDAYATLILWVTCSWTMPLFWVLMGALFRLTSSIGRPGYKQRISQFIEKTLDAGPVEVWEKDAIT